MTFGTGPKRDHRYSTVVGGRGDRVACLWQIIKEFNGVTDKLGSQRRPPTTADISLSEVCVHKHTQTKSLYGRQQVNAAQRVTAYGLYLDNHLWLCHND